MNNNNLNNKIIPKNNVMNNSNLLQFIVILMNDYT